jgi:DNA-directed RNA polymerase I, II, and III subunit RPABC1
MATIQDEQLNQIFRGHRTLLQMLQSRGYIVADDQINLNKDDLRNKLSKNEGSSEIQNRVFNCEQLNNLYKKKNRDPLMSDAHNPEEEDSMDKIAVFWVCDQEKVNSEVVKKVQL